MHPVKKGKITLRPASRTSSASTVRVSRPTCAVSKPRQSAHVARSKNPDREFQRPVRPTAIEVAAKHRHAGFVDHLININQLAKPRVQSIKNLAPIDNVGVSGVRLCNNRRLHSSHGNKTSAEARRARQQVEGSALCALAQPKAKIVNPKGLRQDRRTNGRQVNPASSWVLHFSSAATERWCVRLIVWTNAVTANCIGVTLASHQGRVTRPAIAVRWQADRRSWRVRCVPRPKATGQDR